MDDKREAIVCGGLFDLIACVVAAGVTHSASRAYYRKEAVEAGVAHWEADPQTGAVTFKFGCPCQEDE